MAKQFLSAISCYPGAVGSPGLYLGSDTSTGFYRIGANNIGVAISGSKVLDVSSTGLTVTGILSSTTLTTGIYLSIGGGATTVTPANYGTFGVNNHGSLLFTSNLYMDNGAFKIANTHATMSGASMLVPGNGQTRQGFFEFWTTPVASVTAGNAYLPTLPVFTISTGGQLSISATKRIYLDGINADGNTYITESSSDVLDLYAGGINTLRVTAASATITGTLYTTSTTTTHRITSTTTTGTTIGNKGCRVVLASDSSTVGNGGEVVFAATDVDIDRWAAISGHIIGNGVDGCIGDIVFATKTNSTDTSLTERVRIGAGGAVTTAVSLQVELGVEATLITAYTGTNYGAIYSGGVTPGNSNFVLAYNATTSYLNATSGVGININNVTIASIAASGVSVTGTLGSTGTISGSNLSGTNTGDNAANSSTHYIGTTAIALNRSSAAQALTGITSIDGNAATATELVSTDLRATALTPSYFGMGVNFAFMQNSTDGLSDGATYHTVMQVQQWSDSSGGGSRELAFTDNDNLWIRGSGSALTSWGDWKKILTVNPTTKVSGTFDTTATSPTNTTRLNYDGYLYATRFYGDGSQLTGVTTAPSGNIYAFAAAYG